MRISYFAVAFALGCFSLANTQHSTRAANIAQLDSIENIENIGEITMSVLDRLGYDCDTVAGVGIVCKKCSSDSILTEKCTAYICDAATKKCRKKDATLPKLPETNEE